jgi:hypothetical protein
MAQQGRASEKSDGRNAMPAGVRRALLAVVALLLAGALYLIAVRGEALLAALWGLASLCF